MEDIANELGQLIFDFIVENGDEIAEALGGVESFDFEIELELDTSEVEEAQTDGGEL